MVRDSFLAPRVGRKVRQKWRFGVKWLRDPTKTLHHQGDHTVSLVAEWAPLVVGGGVPRGGGKVGRPLNI